MKKTSQVTPSERQGLGLEWLLRIAALLGLVGFLFAFARTFWGEAAADHRLPDRLGSLAGALVCVAMLLPWPRFPLLRGRVFTPAGTLGVVSRLLAAISLGSLPYLLSSGQIRLALGAVVVSVLCGGLFLRWAPIAWGWYGFVAAGLALALMDLWRSLHADSTSFSDGIRLLIGVPAFLLWGAVLTDLLAWQRERRGEAPLATPAAAAAPDSADSSGPASAPPADADETPEPPPAPDSPSSETPAP